MTCPKQGLFLWITWFLYDCKGCCQAKTIRKPFISSWYEMAVNGTSPLVISHTLNEFPVKVDVQVKVDRNGKNYIFPGLGSAPRDDDIATEYGGVAYAYNATHVSLYVPVYDGDRREEGIGRIVTTGGSSYDGPFVGSMTSCEVRVRAWRLSDWPKPDFSVEDGLTISNANPYQKVQHWLGAYPDFVTVQLYSPEGLVFEGLGTTSITVDHAFHYQHTTICGTVFGIDDTSITLWAASKLNDFVACIKDGWGNSEEEVKSAKVTIHAWILKQSDILYENKFDHPMPRNIFVGDAFDLDLHLVNVEVKDNTVPQGKVFYGAGSASLGNPGEPFGGVVFGYTQSEVVLWTPSPNVIGSNMIYIGGVWGDGTENMEINEVEITVRIIIAGFPECEVPPEIPNAEMMYDGIINGSRTLYSCVPGFSSNGGQVMTLCNGTMWSTTNLTCSEYEVPPENTNAERLINGSRTLYSCFPGFSSNGGEVMTLCNGTMWSPTDLTCSIPPEIPNAEMMYDGIINGSSTLYSCFPGFSSNGGQVMTVCNGTMWSTTNLTRSIQTTTTTQQPLSSPAGTSVSPKSTNPSLQEFQSIVDGLKVGRKNTSAYKRRLTCADDSRRSSKAIGSVGALLISGMIGVVLLSDCLTIIQRR